MGGGKIDMVDPKRSLPWIIVVAGVALRVLMFFSQD